MIGHDTVREGAWLGAREAELLRLLVECHVRDARPVGSHRLVRRFGLPVSSATVRHVLAALGEKRLVTRPHRSAGRAPTGLGYRYYVDHLMPPQEPSARVRRILEERLHRDIADRRRFLTDLTRLVSVVSRQLGVAVLATVGIARITTLELVPLGSRRILAILELEDGAVRTLDLGMASDVRREDIERARDALVRWIAGRDLYEARAVLEEETAPALRREGEVLGAIADRLREILVEEPRAELILGPPGEVAMQAEFSQGERLRSLLRLLEEPRPIVRSLSGAGPVEGVRVRIGAEAGEEGLEELSTVSVRIEGSSQRVILGLLGPIRMDYSRSVSLMGWLGERLKEVV